MIGNFVGAVFVDSTDTDIGIRCRFQVDAVRTRRRNTDKLTALQLFDNRSCQRSVVGQDNISIPACRNQKLLVVIPGVSYELNVGAENGLLDTQVAARSFRNFGNDDPRHSCSS